ncbi:aminotransferase [Shimia biformata]|uniref:aminotransferase n=1 Tax=Shimia biformata TaxID=1294299 RepID=UPI00194EFD8C|nr:aminotransferase [Shimia biformata]
MTRPRTSQTFTPPIMEAQKWLQGVEFTSEKPLINVSQAAPVAAPPEGLRHHIADIAVNDPSAHLYGPVLGLPALRAEVATQWSAAYGGQIATAQVAITSGCNQAFSAAIMALCGGGDEVLLPTPWYFNHKMWLDMLDVTAVPLPTGADLLPDPGHAETLISPRTKAIVLVTPNNPGGVEYPADLVHAFADLASRHGLKLIIDETYRDFDSRTGAPHDLFADPGWAETVVHLYSFSKAYRLTGHRVGAMIAGTDLIAEAEKFLDTVTICPNQIGQHAALWGMRNLAQWLAGERAEILDRRAAISDHFGPLADQGWRLKGVGAYFAYLEHPFDMTSPDLARALVRQAHVLPLPATLFTPEGDPDGTRHLRIAFANVDRAGIAEMSARLAAFRP